MPHAALLEKWGHFAGPAADEAALRFIIEIWSRRGYDNWWRPADALGLPPFALIAEGEPKNLLLGYLRFGNDDRTARRAAMAQLLALELQLKKEIREIGVLLCPDASTAARLQSVLPALDLLIDALPAGSPSTAPLTAARRTVWLLPAGIESIPLSDLAGQVELLLV